MIAKGNSFKLCVNDLSREAMNASSPAVGELTTRIMFIVPSIGISSPD